MMLETIIQELPNALLWGVIGAVVFGVLGLVSGTDETATVTPITLLVVLLGISPVGIFSFFIAAVVSKHMSHAVPTTLLGIPGDTMAIPLMREADLLRRLGVPHVALRKAISAAFISAVIAVPIAVLVAAVLAPVADIVQDVAPWAFIVITALIAYLTPARLGGVVAMIPFVMLILGLQEFTGAHGPSLTISYFLGIAVGPLVVDLLGILTPHGREASRKDGKETYHLSVPASGPSKYFPNPFKVLDRKQAKWTASTAVVSGGVFVFSPVAMTVMMGEAIRKLPKNAYHRLTSMMAVKNGTTEATYIGEALVPLIAFGLPLSPMAVGPAQPLFNAPPRFTVDSESGEVNNLHTFMDSWEFLVFGLLGVILAGVIVYPLVMRYAPVAAKFIMRHVSQEAIIAAFVALIVMISLWEGGLLGLFVVMTVGTVGGLMTKFLRIHAGVQFMGYYVAVMTVPAILDLL